MPLRILIVEDADSDFELIVDHLQRVGLAADCRQVANAEAFATALDAGEWDLLLHDDTMPGFDPAAALRILQARGLDLPFIVISSAIEDERLGELKRAGAHGLVLWRQLDRLAPAIERSLTDVALHRERECATATLRASEARYRSMINDQTEMICRFSPDGELMFVNKAFAEFFGNDDGSLIGQSFPSLFPENDRSTVLTLLRTLSPEMPVATQEYCLRHLDGAVRWQQWTTHLLFDAYGRIDCFQAVGRDITRLKQIESNLREKQDCLRLITDHLPVAIAYVDKTTRYRFVNRTAATWFACNAERVLGASIREILGDAADAKILPYVEAALSGREVTVDDRISYPDGIVRDVQLTYIPDFDDGGTVRGFYATSVDITERKRAARAVQESETRLASVLENAIEAIVSVDEMQRICLFNKGAEAVFGYSAEEVLQRPLDLLIPREYRKAHRVHVVEFPTSSDNRRRMAEPRLMVGLRKDGTVFPAEATLSKVKLGNQVITTAMLHDITARKQAETELQTSEKKYRRILESTTEGYWLVDSEAKTVDVNPALCDILGYPREDLLGSCPANFISEQHGGAQTPWFGQHSDERQQSFEAVLRHRSGRDIHAHIVATTLFDEFGQRLGAFALLRDESDRKRTEEQLHQAQKMEALGQLTGGVAHDLNNLLSVIVGNLQLLERAAKRDEGLLKRINIALQATARGAELTNRLLAFSRRQVLEPQTLLVNDLVHGLTDMLGRLLGETIRIDCCMADDLWHVRADPGQLENVLLNLAINARDAMPDGGTLTIETANTTLDEAYRREHSYAETGDYVSITVSDTGSGMPKDVLKHVFEPFFTTKEVGKGTGLGLSMVYGFVKQSGGYVDVESDVGQGTRVTIYLPWVEPDAAGAMSAELLEGEVGGGTETILVVEDEAQVRETAVTVLQDMGYCVLEAQNGRAALDVLACEAEIDLLFTDVVMPGGIDGLALAHEARQRRPGIGVLYTSGYTDYATMNSNSPDNSGHWLGKPYPRRQLAIKVREALSSRCNAA